MVLGWFFKLTLTIIVYFRFPSSSPAGGTFAFSYFTFGGI